MNLIKVVALMLFFSVLSKTNAAEIIEPGKVTTCSFNGVRQNRIHCGKWTVPSDGKLEVSVKVYGGHVDFIGLYTEAEFDNLSSAMIFGDADGVRKKRIKGNLEAFEEDVGATTKTINVKKGDYWFVAERAGVFNRRNSNDPVEIEIKATLKKKFLGLF
jgi:hypothetical protein